MNDETHDQPVIGGPAMIVGLQVDVMYCEGDHGPDVSHSCHRGVSTILLRPPADTWTEMRWPPTDEETQDVVMFGTLQWLMAKLGEVLLNVPGAEALEPILWDGEGRIIRGDGA